MQSSTKGTSNYANKAEKKGSETDADSHGTMWPAARTVAKESPSYSTTRPPTWPAVSCSDTSPIQSRTLARQANKKNRTQKRVVCRWTAAAIQLSVRCGFCDACTCPVHVSADVCSLSIALGASSGRAVRGQAIYCRIGQRLRLPPARVRFFRAAGMEANVHRSGR